MYYHNGCPYMLMFINDVHFIALFIQDYKNSMARYP